ncbi:MAG: ABC transporter ATP-binding protein [Thermomicrobiales bacterium]
MSADLVVSGVNLGRTYGGRSGAAAVCALDGVDISVAAGELTAIMGPSGCGKSTLLNILGGLDRPTSGELYLGGRRVDNLSESEWAVLRRNQIGFVFQFFNLIGNLTAAGNIELPALLAGIPSRRARQRATGLLQQLGIADQADKLPSELSGGQRQRVALARALVNEPSLLLADEPTGNLDSGSAADVLDLIRTIHAQGRTIIMVTHDPKVAAIADRLIMMQDGQIISDDVPARPLEPGRLRPVVEAQAEG